MGIPYSKEINAAFEQVTPLVAAGFEVLQTTKNIALVVAFIQVLTVILLVLVLVALLGLLVTLNPDLTKERAELVTPVMVWLASWVYAYGGVAKWLGRVLMLGGLGGGGWWVWRAFGVGSSPPNADGGKGEDVDLDKEKKEAEKKEEDQEKQKKKKDGK